MTSLRIDHAAVCRARRARRARRALALLSVLALMQACGGGGGGARDSSGGGGGGGGNPTAPGNFSANVQFDSATQRFVATWNASAGAEHYRVLLKRDEAADFAPLIGADNLPAATLDFSFAIGFTIQWSAAALRVEACNAVGCTPAADLPLMPHLVDALARKKILNVPAEANEPQVASSADGNTLVIGAPLENGDAGLERDKGVVYVFTRAGTTWTEQPTLLRAPNGEGGSSPGVTGDNFGQAVALSADGATLVVGAPREDGSRTSTVENENDDATDAGVVYIFVRTGATYELQTYLKPTPAPLDTVIAGDRFGSAVALAADAQTLVVGAPFAEGGIRPINFDDGAAYVFTRDAAAWTQRSILGGPHANDNEGDHFSSQVTISADGSTLAAGAPFDDGDASSTPESPNANASLSGAAYVFATTDRVQWLRQAYLKAPNAEAEDIFGIAVALSADGNALAIGASGEDGDATSTLENDNNNHDGAGAGYVYTRSGADWSAPPTYLKPTTTIEIAEFGTSLSLTAQGNEIAISAPFDRNVPPLEGAVFVFVRVGSSWRQQARFDGTEAEFGNTVALTPDAATLFIAAEISLSSATAGAVHVY